MEGGSRRDSAPHWRGQLPPSPPPEVSFIYTRTHTRAHPCARGGRTPSQVGWGLPRALLRCTKGAEQGLGCSPALAQPRLAFLFDFTFFFPPPPPPLHFFPSLSFSFKWKSLANWGGLGGQGEPRQAADSVWRKRRRNFVSPAPVGLAAPAVTWWDPAQGKPSCRPPGCWLILLLCSSQETSHWR